MLKQQIIEFLNTATVTTKMAIVAFAAWAMSFIMPVLPFLIFTIVLIFADLYTGTQAAKHRGEVIHSRGLRRSVVKINLYLTAILLSKAFDNVFSFGLDLTYVVSALIAVTELKSNFENIGEVTGIDFWERIADKLPSLNDIFKKKE